LHSLRSFHRLIRRRFPLLIQEGSFGLADTHVCVTVGGMTTALLVLLLTVGQLQAPAVRVVIETEFGDIEAEIDAARAPITSANFLKHVDGGFFRDAGFSRTVTPDNQPNDAVKIEVIQSRLHSSMAGKGFPAIPLERTNATGIQHKDGTLSMARGGPDSATSSFFICLGDQPSLDFAGKRNADGQGFAAFGRVVKGMEVVKKIQQSPAQGQNLTPPIRIIGIRRN
jgi:peptidyl-prolyl cis-trans isomerase A (cyclophilin A)